MRSCGWQHSTLSDSDAYVQKDICPPLANSELALLPALSDVEGPAPLN